MSSKILGVTPTSTAFDTLAIRQRPEDGLAFSRGVVTSPHGNIQVAWERKPFQLTMNVTVPPGTEGTLALPIGQAPDADGHLRRQSAVEQSSCGGGAA